MKSTKAIYAFSGDPITLGHINIIERASLMFQELVVGIGINPTKKYLFTLEERLQLAKDALSGFKNVNVVAFHGLLVDYAFENNIPVIIRGIRNTEDFNFELMFHQIGESQKMNIETIFFPTNQNLSHISSGAVKALQLEQGLVYEYVPLIVKQKLEEKLSGQYIVGVTGEIGSGKSYVSQKLCALGHTSGIPIHTVDIDKVAHEILESLSEPLYEKLREKIAAEFGEDIKNNEGYIDRKKLGRLLFNDRDKLKQFNDLISKPLLLKLRRQMYGKRGIMLLDSALILESNMSHLCNNNIILVHSDTETQLERLVERTYSEEQINQRMSSQYSYDMKLTCIEESILQSNHGQVFKYNNSKTSADSVLKLFETITHFLKVKQEAPK